MKTWLDTNVVLRYLLDDDAEQSARVRALFDDAYRTGDVLVVAPIVMLELVFILEGRSCGYEVDQVYDALTRLAREPVVEVHDEHILFEALRDHRDHGVDFADAVLMATARLRAEPVCTFDRRHFDRLEGEWREP